MQCAKLFEEIFTKIITTLNFRKKIALKQPDDVISKRNEFILQTFKYAKKKYFGKKSLCIGFSTQENKHFCKSCKKYKIITSFLTCL